MSGLIGAEIARPKVKSVEWYTPAWILDAIGLHFDLDPASPHDAESFVPATKKYTVFDDGLSKEWFGNVWLNPPYGRDTPQWMKRMIAHGNGIALVFSRTDAAWFHESIRTASAVLFVTGRIEFVPGRENAHKRSRCGAGSVLFAWGEVNVPFLARLKRYGYFIDLSLSRSGAN